jgi:hypothetical protein
MSAAFIILQCRQRQRQNRNRLRRLPKSKMGARLKLTMSFLAKRLRAMAAGLPVRLRIVFFGSLLLLAPLPTPRAQLMYAWSYQEMFDKAELIVIAKPLSTKNTNQHKTESDNIQFVGLNTQCEVRLILKGKPDATRFTLHHYRLVETKVAILNAPQPIIFDLKEPYLYLMFLIKEPDGRYAPATGQMESATLSMIKLLGGPT